MSTDTNLQVYLKLNELRQGQNNTKEVHDFSKNEYHGVVQGQPMPTADDRFGSCLNLGEKDSIKIDKGSQNQGINLLLGKTDSFTLGFWFKPAVEEIKEGEAAIVLSVNSTVKAEQQSLTIVQKTLASEESASLDKFGLQLEINGKAVIEATSSGRIKHGEWNHIAIAIDRKAGEQPKLEIYLNEVGMNLDVDDKMLNSLALKDCVIEIAPQSDRQKFIGQVAHLRIYSELLSLAELQKEIQDDETATSAFNKSHPIEFDLRNENDEHILYISDKEEQSLILEITNTSAEDIEFQSLKSGETWQDWKADESCYHFQLSFRPGTLSDFSREMLQSPEFRLARLAQGWDCVYDPDNDNLVDWLSFLWIGEEGKQLVKEIAAKDTSTKTNLIGLFAKLNEQIKQPTDSTKLLDLLQELQRNPSTLDGVGVLGEKLDNGCYGIRKKGIGIVKLGGIGAAVGGGARGTRVHLKYDRLSYSVPSGSDATQVPSGTRSQFLNIINRQGKANIPLHVGFVGSNTILNDGVTSNELTLRITNLQKEPLPLEGGNGSPQFRIYFDFEDRSAGNGKNIPQLSIANGNKQETAESQSSEEPEQSWFQSVVAQVEEVVTKTNESATSSIESDKKLISQPAQLVDWKQDWSIASLTNAQKISVAGRDPDDQEAWKIKPQDLQTPNPHWLLEPNCQKLAPRESFEFLIQNLISDAPDGFASLYVEYKNIPGYWDGRIICLIEKSPLVYRQQAVGIGTDSPKAKLHISVRQENAAAGSDQQKPVAVFEGGNVGIGVADPKIHLAIGDNDTGLKQQGDGELAIYTNDVERIRINKNGNVNIGITDPTSKLQVGGTITATAFVGQGAVIAGMIVMWSGRANNIPAGWALCDGQNNTPDLRSRFLVGAASDDNSTDAPHQQGEPDQHSHRISVPGQSFRTDGDGSHTHAPPDAWYKREAGGGGSGCSYMDVGGIEPRDSRVKSDGWHDHSVTINLSSFNSESDSSRNRPKWYAICFIMKLKL